MKKPEVLEYDIKAAVRLYLSAAKKRNPHISLRALAKSAKINPTSLSLFLNGKRDLSTVSCKRLLERITENKPLDEEKRLLELGRSRHEYFPPKDSDHIAIQSDWIPFAILAYFETEDAKFDIKWIARRMHLPVKKVSAAIALLKRLELLKADSKGQLRPTGKILTCGSLNPSKYIRRNQFNCFARSKWTQKQLENGAKSNLPISYSMTIAAANPANIEKVRLELVQFRRRIEKLLGTGSKKEVYMLGIDFLPLTAEFLVDKGV